MSVYNIKTLTRFTNDALSHPIEIEQKPDADVPSEADGTGRRLWATALVLSRYLCAHPHLVAGKRVIELGSGPGCTGLVCAALGALHVVLTDMPEALPLCRDNLARNPRLASRVSVAPCAWGDGPSIAALLAGGGGFDVVIACEVVYKQAPEVLRALAATLTLTLTLSLSLSLSLTLTLTLTRSSVRSPRRRRRWRARARRS